MISRSRPVRWAKPIAAVVLASCLGIPVAAPSEPAGREGGPSSVSLTQASAEKIVQELLPEIEEIRGLRFREDIRVALAGSEDVRRHARARLARFYPDGALEARETAFRLLGLLEPAARLERLLLEALDEQVAGFYDPETKTLYLRDRLDPAAARVFAAHELAHALEDQHFDLERRLRRAQDNEDLGFALSAVQEGSAMLVMALYVVRGAASGTLRSRDVLAFSRLEAERTGKLGALPPLLRRQLLASYVLGLPFLLRGNLQALAAGFPLRDADQAFREGPVSSEQILHPEKYWDPARRDEPREVSLDDLSRILGKRWRKLGGDVLGELALGCLVGASTEALSDPFALMDSARWSHEAATGWDGDRWELWSDGSSHLVVLKSVWDSPADAEQFATALGRREDWSVGRRADTVVLLAGNAGRRRGKLLSRLLRSARDPSP